MKLKTIELLIPIFSAYWMAGCSAVGPDHTPPYYPSIELTKANSTATFDVIKMQWWEQFDDQSLNQLIEISDEHNPSIDIAYANLMLALAIFDDVEDNNWPTGSMAATYNAQKQVFVGGPGVSELFTIRGRQLGLNVGWELDLVGKFQRAEEAATADAEAAFFAWQEARLALLTNVANTYIQYRGFQARLSVAEGTLNSLTRTASVVDSQVEAGFATKLDALRVQSQISRVRANIPTLIAAQEASKQMLIALAGGEEQLSNFEWQTKALPELVAPIPLENSRYFLQQRPDVRAAERQLASSTAGIGIATADLYPSLSLNGFLGFFSVQGGVFSSNAEAWSIAPTLSWQAFDLDSVHARIRAADATRSADYGRFRQTVLQAIAETQTALSDYTQLEIRLKALGDEVDTNQEALTLAQFRYRNGSIDLLDLLDVERQWLASRDQQVVAKAEMTRALVNIYAALGGGMLLET